MQVTYEISYQTDSDLLLTPQDLRSRYLYGVNIKDESGNEIDDEALEFYIRSAQKELEDFLYVKFKRQVVTEEHHFHNHEWMQWGYIRCSYPVVCALQLEGYLNTIKQVTYPVDWLSSRQVSGNDEKLYMRNLYVVPAGGQTGTTFSVAYTGLLPQTGYRGGGRGTIPNYWTTKYVTGFNEVPSDILEVLGMMSTFGAFNIAGDLILGAGIASQSLSIDGLSQSIGTTSSATNSGYGARLNEYGRKLKNAIPNLRNKYMGINFSVC